MFVQIDLIFYAIILIAVIFGLLRGLKKSIFNFITMAIFYIVFFLTLNTMVNMLWTMNLSFLGSSLSGLDASLSGFQSFENDYQAIVNVLLNGSIDFTEAGADALAVGLIQFVIKIVWFIAYFTVILVIYKIITTIIRFFFVKNKENKHRLGGALVGVLNGAMAVFVTMIVLGGSVSFIESATLLVGDDSGSGETVSLEYERDNILELNQSLITENQIVELAEEDPLISDEMVQMMNDLVDNYNQNILVSIANNITVDSAFNEGEKVPMHVNLFDQVLSFEYEDQPIALRHEVSIFANVYSQFEATLSEGDGVITSLTGEQIRNAFVYLEQSAILPAVIPVAIKYVANESDITLSLTDTQIYNIDYDAEVERIGIIMGGVFDILNEETTSIDQDGNSVPINGEWVEDIFVEVANSELILLATETFLVPMIEEADGILSQIVELDDDFDWEGEFLALGNILGDMVDAGVSISAIEGADAQTLLGVFSSIQPATLLSSDILTEGLINILNGETDIEGLDVLSIPTNITWISSDTVTGELEYILTAIQAIIDDQDTLDLENFDIDLVNALTSTTIDAILDSYIIRATITDQVAALELGDFDLVVPDQALDAQDYYTKEELSAILNAVQVIYDDIDTFDLDTLFALDASEYSDLFDSTILRATITDQLTSFSLGDDTLVIPSSLYETTDYLYKDALIDLMLSIKVIASDLDTFTIDVLYDLTNEDYTQLFNSVIIRATLTNLLASFDLGTDTLVIPSDVYDVDGYITTAALTNLMTSFNVISSDIETFSVDALFSKTNTELNQLFNSKIVRATVTNIMDTYSLGTDALVIPSSLYETPDYLTTSALTNLMASLSVISSSIDTFDVDILFGLNSGQLDDLFTSIIVRATVTNIMESFSLGSNALVIPNELYETSEYLTTAALSNLMLSLNVISGNVDSFSVDVLYDLNESQLNDLFTSIIVRATVTNIMTTYNLGTYNLVIPDAVYEATEYMTQSELVSLMLGISLFSSDVGSFTLDSLYTLSSGDLNDMFDSQIMQATMSDIILDQAMATQDPNQLNFIVPAVFRENIDVDSVSTEQVEKDELVKIILSFNALGISDYDGGISPSLMSVGLDYTTILDSGSMHATFDNVIDQNSGLDVPDLAVNNLYGFIDVMIKDEIVNLINAVDALGTGDLTDVNFTFAGIAGLDAGTRSTIVQSMTVRNMITPDIETAGALMMPAYTFANTDYENDLTSTFLRVTVVEDFLTTYSGA